MFDLSKARKNRIDIVCILILIITMVLIVLYELDFTNRDFAVYEVLSGDEFGVCATIQAIREEGVRAAFFIDRWGAPDISSELCNPSVDLLTTTGLWIIGWFTPNSAYTFYMYFIATFVLCALCMYLFMRIANINAWISCMISAIYSLAPYHFLRIPHTAFIGYYTIPLCMIMLYYIVDFDSSNKKVSKVLLFMCALIVGLGNPYYFFFGLMLFALSYLILIIRLINDKKTHSKKDWIKLIFDKCWAFVLMCITFFACQLPRVIYMRTSHNNYNAVGRFPYEAETFGLKMIQMVLPSPYHNSRSLQNITHSYNASGVSVNENMTACLGLLGVLGMTILFFELYKNLVLKETGFLLIDFLALSNLLLLLVGTVGGLGTIFNYLITAQFRSYNRISIFIACLCLTGLAITLEKIVIHNKPLGLIIVISFLVMGLYDQVPLKPLFPYNVENSAAQKQLEAYFNEIESVLGENKMVYQLPYMQFPENGYINNLPDASHFQGYVFTDTLKWSYGGIKGINTTAKELNIDDGMSESFLCGLVEAGFSGIYINRDGYADNGKEIMSFYEQRGIKPIVSENGSLLFYDISDIVIDTDKVYQEQLSVPGYQFIYELSTSCGSDITSRKCAMLAEKLYTDPLYAAQTIYDWLTQSEIDISSNEKYIEMLYTKILGRQSVAKEESNDWIMALDHGLQTRLDILYSFLTSQEFQNKYSIQGFVEYDVEMDLICFTNTNYNADKYVSSGISYNGDDFVWSDGNKIEFQKMKLSETGEKAYLFTLSLLGVYNGEQQVIIFCNGTEVMNRKIKGAVDLVIPITTDNQGIAELTISLPDAISPKEIGESNDARKLALRLEKIQISQFTILEES